MSIASPGLEPTRLLDCAATLKLLAEDGWWPAEHALATAERLERLAEDLGSLEKQAG